MSETWRPVVGWEGLYEVSDQGRVRSLRTQWGPRREPLVMRPVPVGAARGREPRWAVVLHVHGERTVRNVYRLVLEAFVGPCPKGMEALHANDDLKDNRLENLSWGTRRRNMEDAKRNGRTPRGARNGNAKLSAEAVARIKAGIANDEPHQALAARFKVSRSQVGRIARGEQWGEA